VPLDEDIHLLPDKESRIAPFDLVQHLENPRVDALRTVASECAFRHDERLDADEAQRRTDRRITAQSGDGSRLWATRARLSCFCPLSCPALPKNNWSPS
jgi:hypothetical protein